MMYFFLFYSMVNIKTHAKNLSTFSSTREKPNLAIKYYHGVLFFLLFYPSTCFTQKKGKRKKEKGKGIYKERVGEPVRTVR